MIGERSNDLTAGSTRRSFLKLLAASSVWSAPKLSAASARSRLGTGSGIDVNVYFGTWPLRRLPADEPRKCVAKLETHGITEAWVGSFDALLHRDLSAVNERLASDCQRERRSLLRPFGSVNPTQANWEEDLHRCIAVHRMPGLRLFPSYHGYRLDHPEFVRLLQRAAESQILVQIALVMEDERMMHPLLRVEPVDPTPLIGVVRQIPDVKIVLTNALRTLTGSALQALLAATSVRVEISMLEGVAGVERLLEKVPLDRVLFGSYAPQFYFEAALLKLQESRISLDQRKAILGASIRRWLG